MSRRLWPPLVIVLLLTSAAIAAYWGIPHVALSRDPNDVDHVTLYQNGLAAISLVRPFEAAGGEAILTLSLPTTTIFDSLTVGGEGVTVQELRSSLAADPALHPGDHLLVHTDDGALQEGTFQAQDGDHLLLSKQGGTVVVLLSHVTSVEVTGRTIDPSGPGSTSVQIKVGAAAGPHTVRISYLAQGAGWNPNYILEPATGKMTFFATLTGLQDWRNVTLDLVAGNPNMVYTPSYSDGRLKLQNLGGVAYDSSVSTSTYAPAFEGSQSLGAMHRYHYPGTVDLALGETVRLPVVTGRVDVVRHYFQATGNGYAQEWMGLPEIYQIKNTLGETLPVGPVRLYIGGEWVGADNLQALGKGEQGNLTAALSDDVKARVTQESQTRSDPVYPEKGSPNYGSQRAIVTVTTTYDLQVRNLGDASVDLRSLFHANEGGTTRVTDLQPKPDATENGAKVWNEALAAGATLHHRVTIQTTEESYIPAP